MPHEWALSIVFAIFKGKGDIRNCSCYRPQKPREHGMNVVKMVLEKMLHRIVTNDLMPFWLYARERNNWRCVYLEKAARRSSR